MKKIHLYMCGGLGNQLFEYAAAITTQKGSSNMLDDSLSDGVIEMQERVDTLLRKMTALNIFND